jgi:hypothetical protein
MYSVLDTRTVKAVNSMGAPQDFLLVRLQCPWADAVEWSGRCSDMNDHFWTPDVKKAFNSQNQMEGQDKINKRFIHAWYEDDGIFCMRIEDFMETFSQLVVCRDFPR